MQRAITMLHGDSKLCAYTQPSYSELSAFFSNWLSLCFYELSELHNLIIN